MKTHESEISQIAEIQEHVLVSGKSHTGLWLGPSLMFKPEEKPNDLHFFFSTTDRKGGDSLQASVLFTASEFPENAEDFERWQKLWKTESYPEALLARTDKDGYQFVPSFNWKFHKHSGKFLGIGYLLRHKERQLANHVEHLAITYSIYDPADGTYTSWKSFQIKIDEEEKPCVASAWIELSNGDILLPFSAVKELNGWDSIRWCGSMRCRLDGKSIRIVEQGPLFTNQSPRGFVEPYIEKYDGRYYMTLRAEDGHGHVSSSNDGIHWERPKTWRWDNGDEIAMDQTMTKFISHPDGLFLVYTRITEGNGNVFRHRAPVFIAQVDPASIRLIRKTESIIFGNNGYPLGNFNVWALSPHETWVTTQEWDRTGREIACNNLLCRIIWKS